MQRLDKEKKVCAYCRVSTDMEEQLTSNIILALILGRDGILTSAGKKRWHISTIRRILSNEKYMGDALLQKTYTVDFLTKKRVKNNGVVPQYYVENSHESIIPKEIFMQVQD